MNAPSSWGAVIVAAGRGTRFGKPKQFVEIAGRPMVAWSIDLFVAMPEIGEIAIVTEPDWVERMQALALPRAGATEIQVLAGGADRQASAWNGIRALSERCTGILVHDGARPLVRAADVRAGMAAVRPGLGALLGTAVVDTIKVADPEGKVLQTLDRATLWAAQTPQFATAGDMRRAHAEAAASDGPRATDDAALLEAAGLAVVIVPGPPENFKVTHAADRDRADALLASRPLAEVQR